MGLPWTQIASEVIEHGAADLALMLDWDEANAGWGLVKLFDWALKRADPKRPPSHSDTIRGPSAAKLVARAAGWLGDPGLYVSACEHLPKPPVERLEDGGIRVNGLDRYDRAWRKSNKDWREPVANSDRNSDGTVPESGTNPAPVAPEPRRESAGLPPQDRDRDREVKASPPRTPEPVNANDTLRDAVERMWERQLGNRPTGISDADLRAAYDRAGGDAAELLRVLANALKSSYPTLARFPDILKFWDKFASTRGPEPDRKKNPNARATQADRVDADYSPPLTEDGEIDLMGVGS